MSGRSIFDITDQNFGRLDETIKVANDNGFSLNDEVTDPLVIGNYEGDIKKKDAIALQGLTFNNNFVEPEEVVIPEPDPGVGVLDFDGIDDYIGFNSVPDVTGTKTISFDCYFPELATGSGQNMIINIEDGTSDFLTVYFGVSFSNEILFEFVCSDSALGSHSTILDSSNKGKILHIVVNKTVGNIDSIYINDVLQSGYNITEGFTSGQGAFEIGRLYLGEEDILYSEASEHCYIWNININDEHLYLGIPNGNTDEAWIDQIGSINGTVYGSPTTIDLEIP
jgi:hypothetical protein